MEMWFRQAGDLVVCPRADENEAPVVITTRARIMVVDDDELVRETLAEQLEAEGFATLVAASGVEASRTALPRVRLWTRWSATSRCRA